MCTLILGREAQLHHHPVLVPHLEAVVDIATPARARFAPHGVVVHHNLGEHTTLRPVARAVALRLLPLLIPAGDDDRLVLV